MQEALKVTFMQHNSPRPFLLTFSQTTGNACPGQLIQYRCTGDSSAVIGYLYSMFLRICTKAAAAARASTRKHGCRFSAAERFKQLPERGMIKPAPKNKTNKCKAYKHKSGKVET
jgi:hypothetical protein